MGANEAEIKEALRADRARRMPGVDPAEVRRAEMAARARAERRGRAVKAGVASAADPGDIRELPVGSVIRDGGTQMRVGLDDEVVGEYAEAIRRGDDVPPIEVVGDGDHCWVWDGLHRLAAAEAAGRLTIGARVRAGTLRDAILLAVGANAVHGLRRSNEAKRNAVLALLRDPEWSQWSDNSIATRARVSNGLVATVRAGLRAPAPGPDPVRLAMRAGKPTPMATGRIGGWDRARAANASRPTPHVDPEIRARSTIAATLDALPPETARRVIEWAAARLGIEIPSSA